MNNSIENCVTSYMEDVSKYSVMTRREEVEAFKRLETDDPTVREEIIQSNLRFVVKIALGYQGRGLQLSDLIQEGNMGLLEVIERFDYRLGYRFSTYAAFWIRQSIQAALKKRGSLIHIPVRKTRQFDKMNTIIDSRRMTHGQTPTLSDLAEAMDMDEERIREISSLRQVVIPIDRKMDRDSGSIGDTLDDGEAIDVREKILHNETSRHVANALAVLTNREREILELRFGLLDGVSRSLREVSREVSLSQEGVRRIERRAFDKLRRHDATMPLIECA